MDGVTDWDLYAVVKGIYPIVDASSSSFVAAIPTTTTTTFIPTTTITPIISVNNDQILDGNTHWSLDEMVNGFYPTIDSSPSSLATIIPPATTTTFIPTITPTPIILENNNQDFDGIVNWNLDAMLNGLYPTIGASTASFDGPIITTSATTPIPTITTTPNVHLNSSHMLDGTIGWNLHAVVNGVCPTIATSSPSISMPNTLPITSTSITFPNIPMDIYNPQNSRFREEMSNQLQSTNENNVIEQLMQISNNPLNFPNKHKRPLSSKNWPTLSIPCFGKIPEPYHQQQQNQLQGRQLSLHVFLGTSKFKKRENDMKRIYKMPRQGLNTDVWSWKKYGEKYFGDSPHPRIYYRCDSTSDCKAKRRVEQNRLDPNSLILTYIGQHNHPIPMNYVVNNINYDTTSSKNTLTDATECLTKKKNDEDLFEGLENFVNL